MRFIASGARVLKYPSPTHEHARTNSISDIVGLATSHIYNLILAVLGGESHIRATLRPNECEKNKKTNNYDGRISNIL